MEKAKDICVKCGKIIRKHEQACVVDGGLVCIECDSKLLESKNASKPKEHNIPKKKICIWAKISFFSALSCWIILVMFIAVADANGFGRIIEKYVVFIFIVLPFIAFLSGIVGLIRIKTKKDILKGGLFVTGGLCLSFLFLMGTLLPPLCPVRAPSGRVGCGSNISGLGKAILLYAHYDGDGRYPTPSRWCDLLVKYEYVDEKQYLCECALKTGDKGRCHYAINPNCGPYSPGDTVLLFETKGGWNQYGGPELLTTEHHEGKGCNVLFNSTIVRFISTEQLSQLKWDNKPTENQKQ